MSASPSQYHRVRTPTILQMEAVECGAAALGIVLGYHGRVVSLEELRLACGVSRDGTKAGNIIKAGRTYGLVGKGFSKQSDELPALPLPAIVFWNFNHFLVVEGFGRDRVYLNDPAYGPRTVSRAEFDESFTGVVLTFEPGKEFAPGGTRRGLIGPLKARLRGSVHGLAYVVLASFLLSVVGLLIPLFGRVFVDHVLAADRRDWVGPLLAGVAVTGLLRVGLTWLQRYYLLRLETKLALGSSYRFLRHVLRLPMEFYQQRYGGEVGNRVQLNDRVARLLSRELAASLLNVAMAIVYLALMTYLDLRLTAVAVVFAGLNLGALWYVSRVRKDLNARLLQERAKLQAWSMAGLQVIETVKAAGMEPDVFSKWAGQYAKVQTTQQQIELYTRCLSAVPTLLWAMSTVAILGVGGFQVMHGAMTAGSLVAFWALAGGFTEPVNQLVGLGATLQEVEGELNRLDDVLRYPEDPVLAPDRPAYTPNTPPKLAGGLELQGVTYGYSRLDPPLLVEFNLYVRPGARVALVGSSGSGKSTIARLVCGLHQPWEGRILFDGTPVGELPREVVSNSLALVDQEFFLFEGTVREVLSMWDPTVPDEVLVRAAKDACVHDDIAARQGGYDGRVEEGGETSAVVSGSGWRLLGRLVSNPTLLILDEATSALDPVTEKRIDENLRRRGCTCLIVAHRLSTIRDCDEIIVLDGGRVIERGTHEHLMAAGGQYRRLVEA